MRILSVLKITKAKLPPAHKRELKGRRLRRRKGGEFKSIYERLSRARR